MKNSQVHHTHRNKRFSTVNIAPLENPNLSSVAKFVLYYALTRQANWNHLTTRDIAAHCKEGHRAIGRALVELEICGHVKRRQELGPDGKCIRLLFDWYEQPVPPSQRDGVKEPWPYPSPAECSENPEVAQ